jgi:hypothetical protein
MKHYAGWYVLGLRAGRVLAIVAGPVQDRAKAESLNTEAARKLASARYGTQEGDTFMVGWLALPQALPGAFNAELWLKGEFQEYDA